ncbi:MAG: SpoIIE family protein phosphatase, partial [Bacteroidia bacterium]|nr:SpoIIE family protein phosphatase [Bacteroidia bacterium]
LCSINLKTLELQWSGANNPLFLIQSVALDPQGHVTEDNNQCNGSSSNKGDPSTPLRTSLAGRAQPIELKEIKADKMPIGIYDRMDKFILHELKLNKGDIIYLAGDGYQDQFGGPNGKKFLSKRFKKLLVQTCPGMSQPGMSQQIKSMEEQREILDKTIEDWIQGYETNGSTELTLRNQGLTTRYEQTDDITILGLKI